jgi:hypothetical protein
MKQCNQLERHKLPRPSSLHPHTSRVHLQVPHIVLRRYNERVDKTAGRARALLQDFEIGHSIVLVGMIAHQNIRSILDTFSGELVERLDLQLLVGDLGWDAMATIERRHCVVVC